MRFGTFQPDVPASVRALLPTPPENTLFDWMEAPFPEPPEQRFAYCMKLMAYILTAHEPLQGIYAKRLMALLVETFDYEGERFLLPLSNEPYWQIQVMRMWRPYGLLRRMTREWASGEFSQWTRLASRFVF